MNRRNILKSIFSCALYPIARRLPSNANRADVPADKPILRSFLMPSYPAFPRQAGSEGTVSVTIRIGGQGAIESLKDFSGPKFFYDEIERCLRTWRFEPSDTGPTELRMKFQFALRGKRDERCLNYRVLGELPDSFLIEVNPFPNVNS
jgi:TonB family protein